MELQGAISVGGRTNVKPGRLKGHIYTSRRFWEKSSRAKVPQHANPATSTIPERAASSLSSRTCPAGHSPEGLTLVLNQDWEVERDCYYSSWPANEDCLLDPLKKISAIQSASKVVYLLSILTNGCATGPRALAQHYSTNR